MKKLLAVFLTLCLLLTPMGALADSTTQFTLSMIELTIGDNDPIELGLSLLAALTESDEGVSLGLNLLDTDDHPVLAGGLSFADDGLTATLNGMSNAYRLSPEMLQQLLDSVEEELGMPVEDALNEVLSSGQAFTDSLAPSLEAFSQTVSEVLSEVEITEGPVENVTVMDEEYELQRADITLTAEQFDRLLTALEQGLADIQTAAPEQMNLDIDATDLEGLSGSVDVRLWGNDDADLTVARAEIDLNLTKDGETMVLPLVLELIDDPTNGTNVDLTLSQEVDGGLIQALISYTATENEGASETSVLFGMGTTDADGAEEQVLLMLLADTDAEGKTSYMLTFNAGDAQEEYEAGLYYGFDNTVSEDVMSHDAYVDLWFTSLSGGETTAHYEIDFLLGLAQAEGTTGEPLYASLPVLDVDQLTDEQVDQAQNEFSTVLQNTMLALLNDEGVQQLISLFTATTDTSVDA